MSIGEVRNEIGIIAEEVDTTADAPMTSVFDTLNGLLGQLAAAQQKVGETQNTVNGLDGGYDMAAAASGQSGDELRGASRKITRIGSNNDTFESIAGGLDNLADGSDMSDRAAHYKGVIGQVMAALALADEGIGQLTRLADEDRQSADRRRGAARGLAENIREVDRQL